jgi:glycosyltransferase involved in cell wall biosynthesis
MNDFLKKVICVTPVYNDWESFAILKKELDNEFKLDKNYSIEILVVNDGSIEQLNKETIEENGNIQIIHLKTNVGHQRAIAIGVQYVFNHKNENDYIVVLDSDGEDKPQDIKALLQKCEANNNTKIIFAQRHKRQESKIFKFGYFFYKYFFYWLTGQKINFGNFSCIPSKMLKQLVYRESLWNHYSSSIIHSKLPYDKVLLDRGKRYAGTSKMNLTSLILHGLSSISVYFDSLSIRILKLALLGVAFCFLAVIGVIYIKLFTTQSIPGWASNLILIIFSIILQLSSVTLIVLLMQLSSRKNIKSPSSEIYKDFIDTTETI